MIITVILPNLCGGGAERLHVNLARDWVARGYSVEFVLMRKKGELLQLLPKEVKITDMSVDRIRSFIFPLTLYLKNIRPNIILAAMWPLTSAVVCSWILSGRSGSLFLSDHEHLSHSYIGQRRVKGAYLKNLIRFTYPLSNGVIAVSAGVKNDLCALGKLSSSKVQVIYNPAAIGVSSVTESMKVRNKLWGGYKYTILAVGRLTAEKNYETLIKAFARLPIEMNAKLIILGEGNLRTALSNLIIELDLHERIELPGFVSDPYPWFRSADLFVLSSLWEGFGNVIVEALECGVPVVSTDCPSGPAEILENGRYGKLVPVGDFVRLSFAMIDSLLETHDSEAMKLRAKDFSVDKISAQYLAYMFPNGLPPRNRNVFEI